MKVISAYIDRHSTLVAVLQSGEEVALSIVRRHDGTLASEGQLAADENGLAVLTEIVAHVRQHGVYAPRLNESDERH